MAAQLLHRAVSLTLKKDMDIQHLQRWRWPAVINPVVLHQMQANKALKSSFAAYHSAIEPLHCLPRLETAHGQWVSVNCGGQAMRWHLQRWEPTWELNTKTCAGRPVGMQYMHTAHYTPTKMSVHGAVSVFGFRFV